MQHIARLLLQNQSSHVVDFWLEVEDREVDPGLGGGLPSDATVRSGGSSNSAPSQFSTPAGIHVELSISYLDRTEALLQAKARLPGDWVSEIWLATVYHSAWEL
jgi:hypothetical protein